MHRLRFDHFSIDQGLPSTGIMTVYQTRNGYIWMGTANGLVRYDGRHMRVFSHLPSDVNTINHDRILSLFEDGQQRLWIGTRLGLNVLDLKTDQIQRISMPEDFSAKARFIYAMSQADDKQLWLGSSSGLLRFDTETKKFTRWQPDPESQAYFSGEVRALMSDKAGGVWIGQGHRVAHVNQAGQLLLQFKASDDLNDKQLLPSQRLVRSLAFDHQGQLWVGLTGGLSIWRINQQQVSAVPVPIQLKIPKASVVTLLPDDEKSMWLGFGEDQGLLRWRENKNTLEKFVNLPSVNSSLSGDTITSLMLDSSGGLWVGTSDYGVSLVDLRGRSFTTYLNIPGDERSLSHRLVTAVVSENEEFAWIGTLGGGLNRLHIPSGDTQRFTSKQAGVDYIRVLMLDDKKQLWIGGESLQVFDPKTEHSRDVDVDKNFPVGARFTALAKDSRGDVWAGSSVGLYQIQSNGNVRIFKAEPGTPGRLKDDAIDSLLVDKAQRLWVGSKGALYLYDDRKDSFQAIGRPAPGLPTPEKLGVTSLRQDHTGRIWAATILGGLVEVRPRAPTADNDSEWELISWANTPQIPNDVIEAMQDADNGEIWMSSERGLMRVRPETKQGRNFPSFGRFDGAFNFAAAARARDGSLLFGGVGLVYFHPASISDNSIAPRVVLSDVLLFNKSLMTWATKKEQSGIHDANARNDGLPIDLESIGISGPLSSAKRIQLNYKQTMVSFELAALYFYNRTQNRYAWKLEGYDIDWIYGQADRSVATYTNLDAGSYRLLAKAANPDGVWSESVEVVQVVVLPPFWRTWWWYGLWILVVLALARLVYQQRLRSIRENQLYLERQVKAQTQEVVEQKRLAETQREIAEQARNDIGRLSEIGLKITSSLDKRQILETLYQSIRSLIPASTFGVGIVDWDKRIISFEYTIQGDKFILPYERSLDANEQPSTRCVLSGQELIVNHIEHDSRKLDNVIADRMGDDLVRLEDGSETEDSRSGVYVPIMLGGRVMGVVGALSNDTNAFSLNDLNILRTLAAYIGVAYDNAEAYRRLTITQSKLVEQEKLAALGSLVAGVAHELNTPIGNSLLMASTMQDMSEKFSLKVKENQLRRSDLENYTQNAINSSDLIVRSLTSAANLVSSFKQIAVDQTSDKRREFDLQFFCEEVALTLSNRSKREGHEIRVEIEAGLSMDSYPGALGQVLNNLIINAMVHGLHERSLGVITVLGRALGDQHIQLVVQDNGAGITPENIERIFEPFFTTRLGTGGSGLGLHICYNIIHSVLGGTITVDSIVNLGTNFTLVLPRHAPIKAANAEGKSDS
ncbi:two-component regulator propeller domain-containing protein [Undibacterium flavidum]|uniref:histidine kinase n=1 Tax=Undibacterium flavidum TaxID=2762297 RepID=A0ABR6Y8C0_9BURK|nr:two-component regulator propeller domain-containing protein [Undibacterium flavidum]MBC3872851.1 GAF domain-containing protein [Undibacterium flavidum]